MIKNLNELVIGLKHFTNPSATAEEWQSFQNEMEDFLDNDHIIYQESHTVPLVKVLLSPDLPEKILLDSYSNITRYNIDLLRLLLSYENQKLADKVCAAIRNRDKEYKEISQ